MFEMVLGRFNLLTHVHSDDIPLDDLEWSKENLLVGNWLYSTISENKMDLCLRLCSPTARQIWVHLGNLFTGNKASHAVHLECDLHNLVQDDLSANSYCHRLQQLANSLAYCDAPVSDRALVHQLIQGLNPKFSVLKTMLPLLPKFPSFVEARELILSEESSRLRRRRQQWWLQQLQQCSCLVFTSCLGIIVGVWLACIVDWGTDPGLLGSHPSTPPA
jgi:hypothetical protein